MILLTGSTGFLGKELLARFVTQSDKRVGLIVRDSGNRSAEVRAHDALSEAVGAEAAARLRGRIEVIPGDISLERFGLGDSAFNDLSARISSVFHCAASTTLNLPIEESRRINVQGTAQVLNLAESSALQNSDFRLHYVSTAYVAGATERTVRASDLKVGGDFRNSYEQCKAESEYLVRGRQNEIQTTIYRPSVIVGDSITGRTSAFNVVYVPARLLIAGLCKAIPALPHTPFDVVPINYVADAIVLLSNNRTSIGECYHLSAGLGRESNPLEIYNSLLAAFDRAKSRRPHHLRSPLFISPDLLLRAFSSINAAAHGLLSLEKKVTEHLAVFTQLMPFIPYMLSNPRFDTHETIRDLEPTLGPPPLFSHYAERVFDYCFQSNWGKKPLASVVSC